jgi:hypothetical protein
MENVCVCVCVCVCVRENEREGKKVRGEKRIELGRKEWR